MCVSAVVIQEEQHRFYYANRGLFFVERKAVDIAARGKGEEKKKKKRQ